MPGLPSTPSLHGLQASPATRGAPRVRRAEGYGAWLALFFAANAASLWFLWHQKFGWALAVFFSPAPWYAWQILRPSARGLGPVITSFETPRREVWLTIDDGPRPDTTPVLLEFLARHNARATFFLIGKNVRRHPELVSEILRQGHTVANHTFSHPHHYFWCATGRQTGSEIDRCNAALREAGASDCRYFRPPVGLKNHALHPELARRNLELVLWTARGFDTIAQDLDKALSRIEAQLRPGAIILAHEIPGEPERQQRFFVRLFELLKKSGYTCVVPENESLIR